MMYLCYHTQYAVFLSVLDSRKKEKERMATTAYRIPVYPACDSWGMSRGLPVDRYYIDAFLSRHSADIRGRVMEVGDDGYSRRFGGSRVDKIDILDINTN